MKLHDVTAIALALVLVGLALRLTFSIVGMLLTSIVERPKDR